MIGQEEVLKYVTNKVRYHALNNLTIITGERGSGKKLLIKKACEDAGVNYVFAGIGTDAVREVIAMAYKNTLKYTVYIFGDAHLMSNSAKNALLKITEEPPENAAFVLTVNEGDGEMPDTIMSRAGLVRMYAYTTDQLFQIYDQIYSTKVGMEEVRQKVAYATTPGEIDLMVAYSDTNFFDTIETLINNINDIEPSNLFKLSSKMSLKEGQPGWDINLFMQIVYARLGEEVPNHKLGTVEQYVQTLNFTNWALWDLKSKNLSKLATLDNWCLDIIKIWELG